MYLFCRYPGTMQKYFLEIFKLSSLWQTAIAEENMVGAFNRYLSFVLLINSFFYDRITLLILEHWIQNIQEYEEFRVVPSWYFGWTTPNY